MKRKIVLKVDSVTQSRDGTRICLFCPEPKLVSGYLVVQTDDVTEIAGWVSRIGKLIELVPGDM